MNADRSMKRREDDVMGANPSRITSMNSSQASPSIPWAETPLEYVGLSNGTQVDSKQSKQKH